MTCITLQRNASGHSSFQVSIKANLTGFGLQRRLPPFLALPSPRAEGGNLLCEGASSPFPRLHAVMTLGHRVDAVEPICSASKAQPPNPMKAGAALNNCAWPSAQHHGETHLCISLPFVLSFMANIARMRPELNRGKTIKPNAGFIPPAILSPYKSLAYDTQRNYHRCWLCQRRLDQPYFTGP